MLNEAAQAKLASSAISVAEAEAAGLYSVEDARTLHDAYSRTAALVLPYYDLDRQPLSYPVGEGAAPFQRVRYLAPVYARRHGFQKPELLRYVQPPKSGIHPYLPPLGDWRAVAGNVDIPVVITEGELKAIAGTLAGTVTIGLGGVWMFCTPDGVLLPTLQQFVWRGRTVYIAYDSDAVTNPQVLTAEARLVDELTRRGARCALVRIPPGPGDTKQGIDDYIANNSREHWVALVNSTLTLSAVDRGVIALNEHLAWIEREGRAYDLRTGAFLSRHDIVNGSRYSALTVAVADTSGRTAGTKRVQTAKIWLTHPYAQRYDDVLMRPDAGATVEEDGVTALNLWRGYTTAPGDIGPFEELTQHLLSRTPPETAELPLKLLAYKAQHPSEKIPLALVLLGPQGCIAGDARIKFAVKHGNGRRGDHKGGTLAQLHRRFHGTPRSGGKGAFYVQSANEDGTLFLNRVHDVIDSGDKEVFCIETASGKRLKATADHQILTANGYVALELLSAGDEVMTAFPRSKKKRVHPYRPEILVKHHPSAPAKNVNGYTYKRLRRSRAVYEAHVNGLELRNYIALLNRSPAEAQRVWTIPDGMDVHHINEDPTYDSIENLTIVPSAEHRALHGFGGGTCGHALPDPIVAIRPAGIVRTYDIVVSTPHRNFVADGVVVHNCGKSLWTECVGAAFSPYTAFLGSAGLNDAYKGWLERSLFVAFQEVESGDLWQAKEKLRSLISDETQHMNEKFRVQRQVRAPCLIALTSNNKEVGSYAHDDRRMIVIGCPPKREKAFYERVRAWKYGGGPAALMHWLATVDLKGWRPPVEAPVTSEKYMAYLEGLSPIQRLAADALTAQQPVVVQWLDSAKAWADAADVSGDIRAARLAEEILTNIQHFQVRPFYTPEEIALIFPALVRDIYGNRKIYSTVAGYISRQLRNAGLPYLENADDPRGFLWKGSIRQYLVIADIENFREPMTQVQFDGLMESFPTYGSYSKWRMSQRAQTERGVR